MRIFATQRSTRSTRNTILNLGLKIEDATDVSPCNQGSLMFGSKCIEKHIEKHQTLSDYKIQRDSTLDALELKMLR